ncbi:hypothetical protein KVT40_007710 [Elsinoe batatas]|uniref:Uncharacterized protein n=1 Tax=Elsinoe batatas TaxID=2601811 RepID=A0A8K0PEW4_9PEZI|nr:hypothetical protein KVT40_007710 [Elsinoe batatas]
MLLDVYTAGLLATLVSLTTAGPSYSDTPDPVTTTHPTALAPFPFFTGKPTTTTTISQPYAETTSDCLIMPTFGPVDSSNLLLGDEETKQMKGMRRKGGFVTATRPAAIRVTKL